MPKPDYDVVIAGGGLAGLTAGILVARSGGRVLLFEKNKYPFHKVCGEYVSNEALEFLISLGCNPYAHGAAKISQLSLTSPSGKSFSCSLEMGGFGLSRYILDEALFRVAQESGVDVQFAKVSAIEFNGSDFEVTAGSETCRANFVLGSFGKRATLDRTLNRDFIAKRSPFLAVKYHVRSNSPENQISLHAFQGGYCGVVKIEEDKYNLCYLYRRTDHVRDIKQLETDVLRKNKALDQVFGQCEFLQNKPEVISEISFEKKRLIEDHIFMLGDSAGLIAPLCGNGMAMAIRSAKLLCDILIDARMLKGESISAGNRSWLEESYASRWNKEFSVRLRTGRVLQNLFLHSAMSELAFNTLRSAPMLRSPLIRLTHGKKF